MAVFNVEFTPTAAREVKRLDPAVRIQLLHAAGVLRDTPYPSSSHRIKLLAGLQPRHYRLRIGDYRIVYRIEGTKVLVVRVAHRREVYR